MYYFHAINNLLTFNTDGYVPPLLNCHPCLLLYQYSLYHIDIACWYAKWWVKSSMSFGGKLCLSSTDILLFL